VSEQKFSFSGINRFAMCHHRRRRRPEPIISVVIYFSFALIILSDRVAAPSDERRGNDDHAWFGIFATAEPPSHSTNHRPCATIVNCAQGKGKHKITHVNCVRVKF
jgi:hypothetical protein